MTDFNPRSPDGERRRYRSRSQRFTLFQSTLPGWGATVRHGSVLPHLNFNPRSPDGERLLSAVRSAAYLAFQSTLPGWGATRRSTAVYRRSPISIHAPRMGSDVVDGAHPPPDSGFQSTLPGWGATEFMHLDFTTSGISIHAPRMGSDAIQYEVRKDTVKFQSTLPGWGATHCSSNINHVSKHFNPRSPDGERLTSMVPMDPPC